MRTHVNFKRVNITEALYERSHVNVKVAASFNLYVYARHTTLCLYYARKICFTSVRTEKLRDSGNPPSPSRVFVTAFARLIIVFFFQLLKSYFNLWNVVKDVWASKSVPAGMRSIKQLPAAAVLLNILKLVLSLKWSRIFPNFLAKFGLTNWWREQKRGTKARTERIGTT